MKLDSSGVRCLLLGCLKQHKMYQLLRLSTGEIVISRSVTFVNDASTMIAPTQSAPIVIDIMGDNKFD